VSPYGERRREYTLGCKGDKTREDSRAGKERVPLKSWVAGGIEGGDCERRKDGLEFGGPVSLLRAK